MPEKNKMQTQIQESQTEIKARIAQLRQDFERLSRNCNQFVRISPATIQAYKEEITKLEAKLN